MRAVLLLLVLVNAAFVSTSSYTRYLGYGWDLLKNDHTAPLYDTNSSCFLSNASFIPYTQLLFEMIETTDMYKSELTLVVLSGGTPIAESFSEKYEKVRNQQAKTRSTYLRRQYRNARLSVSYDQDNCSLHNDFYQKIESIAKFVQAGNKNASDFLIQELVAVYGTHAVIKTVAGGVLITEAFLADSYYNVFYDKTLLEAVDVVFFNANYKVGIPVTVPVQQATLNNFTSHVSNSSVSTMGGKSYSPTIAFNGWQSSLSELNYEPILIEAIPIYELLTVRAFKTIKSSTLEALRDRLKTVLSFYYSVNSHKGCMDRSYRSFSPNANIHTKYDCLNNYYGAELSYGGALLRNRTNNSTIFSNLLSNNSSCSQFYKEISIPFSNNETLGFCVNNFLNTQQYAYFGGGYSSINDNYATGSKSCPVGFTARRLGAGNTFLCESTTLKSYESVPFGGLVFMNLSYEVDFSTQNDPCGRLEKMVLFQTQDNITVYVCSVPKVTSTVQLVAPPFKELPDDKEEKWTLGPLGIIVIIFLVLLGLFCFCC